MRTGSRSCPGLGLVFLVSAAVSGCLDQPLPASPGAARLIVGWDPLGCGEPHRVALELEADSGAKLAASAPCNLGSLSLPISQFGIYRGRIYAWTLGAPIRSIMAVELTVDEPIVEWFVATPR